MWIKCANNQFLNLNEAVSLSAGSDGTVGASLVTGGSLTVYTYASQTVALAAVEKLLQAFDPATL